MKVSVRVAVLLVAGLLAVGRAQGQSTIGVPVPPLGAVLWLFDTAEQHGIRVSVVARGLSRPWAIAFLPDGGVLITKRPGRLRVVRDGVFDPHPISSVPEVEEGGAVDAFLGGLAEVHVSKSMCTE